MGLLQLHSLLAVELLTGSTNDKDEETKDNWANREVVLLLLLPSVGGGKQRTRARDKSKSKDKRSGIMGSQAEL